MKDRTFIDTNIWIYLYANDKKSSNVKQIIESNFNNTVISTQVLNELYNVIANKLKLTSKENTKIILENLIKNFYVSMVDTDVILKAVDISVKYQFSYFDSLMISSAISENCTQLYSEDLHNGQIIENSLQLINPFK